MFFGFLCDFIGFPWCFLFFCVIVLVFLMFVWFLCDCKGFPKILLVRCVLLACVVFGVGLGLNVVFGVGLVWALD